MADTKSPPAKSEAPGSARVACPSCGNFLVRFVQVKDPESVSLMQEHKCRRCHAKVSLTYNAGKVTVSIIS